MKEQSTNVLIAKGSSKWLAESLKLVTDLQVAPCSHDAAKYAVENWHYSRILPTGKIVKFGAADKLFLRTEKNGLFKAVVYDTSIIKAHGCKQPDECYIDEASKVIFILEKKFQQCSGSACEKIQTAQFKRWQFMETFPTYTVEYFYCLSDWFKNNCKREVEWLNKIGVRVFWGDDSEYKKKVVDFMVNYKVQ